MRILGIDPGLANVGYGVIDHEGQKSAMVVAGTVTTPAADPLPRRLKHIHDELAAVIAAHKPDVACLEDIFFCTNVRTAIAVAQGRGACILATAAADIPIAEYTPLQIKMAVTGSGKATKQQVEKMVRALLALKDVPRTDHAADALAVALCHAHSQRFQKLVTAAGAVMGRGKRRFR